MKLSIVPIENIVGCSILLMSVVRWYVRAVSQNILLQKEDGSIYFRHILITVLLLVEVITGL